MKTHLKKVVRKYTIVKLFLSGVLAGLTYEEHTDVLWAVGRIVDRPIGGSSYQIISVVAA